MSVPVVKPPGYHPAMAPYSSALRVRFHAAAPKKDTLANIRGLSWGKVTLNH